MGFTDGVLRFASQRFPRLSRRVLASSGYTLDLESFGPDAFGPWSDATADRQDRAWHPLVERARAGSPREDVVALWRAIDAIVPPDASLLEVGCGGGYNSELIRIRHPGVAYKGVDLSPSMVDRSRAAYPGRDFAIADATALEELDRSWDAVMDGVALIHIPDWRRALAEYARVARRHVVLHGLTLTDTAPTTVFGKYAYGQPSQEVVFARADVRAACDELGLVLTDAFHGEDYDLGPYLGIPSTSETWVLTAR